MILMYHHIAPRGWTPPAPSPNEGWEFRHTPEALEYHVRELKRHDYRIVPLQDIVYAIRTRGIEDDKTVALTFDDGWIDNLEYALPVLKRLSLPATFFITSSHLKKGSQNSWKMNVDHLKESLRAGITIGAHSRSHPDLTLLPLDEAREEIAGSKAELEDALGVEIRFFAYPGGAFNSDVAALVQEASYAAACSILGPARNERSDLFWLYRDTLSEPMDSWHDRYRLSRTARALLEFRVAAKLRRQLKVVAAAE